MLHARETIREMAGLNTVICNRSTCTSLTRNEHTSPNRKTTAIPDLDKETRVWWNALDDGLNFLARKDNGQTLGSDGLDGTEIPVFNIQDGFEREGNGIDRLILGVCCNPESYSSG